MKPSVNDIETDEQFQELVDIVGRYLWRYFETNAPDTPARVFRVVKYALEENGYTITKTPQRRPKMKAQIKPTGGRNEKDTQHRTR